MSLHPKMLTLLKRFCHDRRGAFAISFVIISVFLLSLVSLGLEGARYIGENARLSDATEQAALALSAEDNGPNAPRNYTLSSDYIKAYMRHKSQVYRPTIRVAGGTSDNTQGLTYVEYRISVQTQQTSWFSASFFPSFSEQVVIGDNAAARKYRSHMDVIFVADFSRSMEWNFSGPFSGSKIDELKRMIVQLSKELFQYNIENKVGFVPFGFGTKDQSGQYCNPQFVSNTGSPLPSGFLNTWASQQDYMKIDAFIDYKATVDRIPFETRDFYFPYSAISNIHICLKGSNATIVPLTSQLGEIMKINNMYPYGGTLVSSGLLKGVQELAKGKAPRKVLVIISDGTDDPANLGTTPKLFQYGLCNKIREVLTTSQAVGKIAFIGIGYKPTFNWKACVGNNNYYESNTVSQFRDAMKRSVFEEVGHNALKN